MDEPLSVSGKVTENETQSTISYIKGAGGSEVDFHFFVVSDRRECQLSETFFRMKKILFLAEVISY